MVEAQKRWPWSLLAGGALLVLVALIVALGINEGAALFAWAAFSLIGIPFSKWRRPEGSPDSPQRRAIP